MMAYLSRRKKMIIISAASVIFIGSSFASSLITNFVSFNNEISYNSTAPSLVNKNDPNDLTFFSPVVNSELKPIKKEDVPKADLIKPEEKPEPKPEPEIQKITPPVKRKIQIQKPIETPKNYKPETKSLSLSLSLS
ncbi:hypothetical protein [Mycoplasma sp. 'Moose RK']|uniref:hypothetical protein n=1 Tax=Mycoplasma sp. 'Moose RK' TaxID=2780095 RepID=UPI001E595148